MLMIRLQRIGRKNQAAFRVLVIDSHRSSKAGKNVEVLGSYNPHSSILSVAKDRILYWIGKGAQVSDTVHNLLVTNKIIEGKKINVLPRKSPIKDETSESPVLTPEAPTVEQTPSAEALETHAETSLEKVEAGA